MATRYGLEGQNKWNEPNLPHHAKNYFCTTRAPGQHVDGSEAIGKADVKGATKEVTVSQPDDDVEICSIIEQTSHRDGTVYKINDGFLGLWRIAECDETGLEPMMLSEPTDCWPRRETCTKHIPSRMLQIFSMKVSKIFINCDFVQLYGFIAVRDYLDPLRNYVFNRSRDDPLIVQQGSLIEMMGPKRGISLNCSVLLEFDMRIKKGDREDDDLQLIDGATEYSDRIVPFKLFTDRIYGSCGAVDITSGLVCRAVEATIEVAISEVRSNFSLSLSSFVSISDKSEEIPLYNGTIDESCGLRRYVLSVMMNTSMHLKFKVGQNGYQNDLERYCCFKAQIHGHVDQKIMLHMASVFVKVTWSTLPVTYWSPQSNGLSGMPVSDQNT